MKYWRATAFGEAKQVLRLEERELPELGDGMVELRVEATGVGLPDVLMTRGNYPAVRKPPVTPGQEIAGRVVRVGPGCTLKPGEAVISMTRFAEGMGSSGGSPGNSTLPGATALTRTEGANWIAKARVRCNSAALLRL